MRPTTIRVVLSLVAAQRWMVNQLDFNNAFLIGDLQKPQGYENQQFPTYVCKLHKTLYSLKQAS